MRLNTIEQTKIDEATSKLYQWLDTWRQFNGAYNGYVVHRCDLKRLKEIHETPWGHSAIIEGLISLYDKTPSDKLRFRIEEAVKLQVSRMDKDGSFKNAGFEDDRFSSLVHNAMADRALLVYYNSSVSNAGLKKEIIGIVKRNVDEYFIGNLWNEEIGAFKFSKVDYYSPDEDRYVANMNCVAIEVLLGLYNIVKEKKYIDYSYQCGNWVKTQTVYSDIDLCDGGISYGSNNPQCLVSIYTGLCLPGICRLYDFFHDDEYMHMAVRAVENLLLYTENDYFCHSMDGEDVKRYPFFLAGAGIILYGIQTVNETFGLTYYTKPFLDAVLEKQYAMGGVQNFIHYDSEGNGRLGRNGTRIVWEDIIPCVAWNAQLFRYLAKNSTGLIDAKRSKCAVKIGVGFIYFESYRYCIVFSIYPLKSMTFLWINKKRERSILAFSLKKLVQKIKKRIRVK